MFRKYQTIADVYRSWYTTQDWYKKSGYTATGESYIWHMKAQSINKTQDLTMFGKVFAFHTDKTADIEAGDRLKINWEDYDVQWVAMFIGISFDVKQCLLYKSS